MNQPGEPSRELNRYAPSRRPLTGALPELAARSLAMRRVTEQLQQAGPRIRLALVEGESGTGKHLLVRHMYARHAAQGMLLAEEANTLFNPETGAHEETLRGCARKAADGLLLLRNVDALGPEAQGHLLRFIRTFETQLSQEKPVAQQAPAPYPAMVICTSRKSLRNEVLAGTFLPEIYYRLSAVSFHIPPLRERKEDIPALAQMFIDAVSREQQRPLQGLGPGALPVLLRHLWPGNVRELESVIRAACLNGEGQWLRPLDLIILPLEPAGGKDGEPALPENFTLDGVIRRHILRVLKACEGNKARAAAKLGISRSTLYRMLESDLPLPMPAPEVKQDGLSA